MWVIISTKNAMLKFFFKGKENLGIKVSGSFRQLVCWSRLFGRVPSGSNTFANPGAALGQSSAQISCQNDLLKYLVSFWANAVSCLLRGLFLVRIESTNYKMWYNASLHVKQGDLPPVECWETAQDAGEEQQHQSVILNMPGPTSFHPHPSPSVCMWPLPLTWCYRWEG